MTLQSTKLPNGLRVVTDTVDTVESVAVGIWCDVGARHEDRVHNGVAHMVEHMMFNGTPTRTSKDIVEQIETVGGQMNAYTSRENTAYYVHLLKEDVALAMDVLSDMVQRSTFPDTDLEKERGVIIQEIGMTNDTPDDLVFDLYQNCAYPEQSLGAPILGTADIIANMKKSTLFDYVQNFYNPENLVISAAGNISHDEMLKHVQTYFSDLPAAQKSQYQKAQYKGGFVYEEKELEQSHLVMGFQSISKSDPNYHAAITMATLMGGGMSSRLFQEVREKHGLVYSVYASHAAFHDEGQFEIYAGTGPEKLSKLVPVICDEVQKIKQELVSAEELNRAKSQLRASVLMGRESMLSRANRQAKFMINFNADFSLTELLEKIDAVDVNHIQSIAQKIFSNTPTVAALGPLSKMESYDKIQTRLAA